MRDWMLVPRQALMLAGFLMFVAADPGRVPAPPPPAPVVVTAPAPAAPKPPVASKSQVLLAAQSLIDQTPAYATERGRGWCWAFVEDVLDRVNSPVSPVERAGEAMKTPTPPVPGDLVYLTFPKTAHVGVFESMDAVSITIINGNGSSRSKITRDSYPLQNVNYFVDSLNYPEEQPRA